MKKEPSKRSRLKKTKEHDRAEEYLQHWQRTQAELENLQKRVEKERGEFIQFAARELIFDLLPIVDNFDRAVASTPPAARQESWLLGITYIHKQLLDMLAAHGVTKVTLKEGDIFDEQLMSALQRQPHERIEKNHLISVTAPAYRMHGTVIRPATVIVSAGRDKERDNDK